MIHADLSEELLTTILRRRHALHDGAVIVRGDRIEAGRRRCCRCPRRAVRASDYGTRHRAALGITEQTDAVAVVVSEETGVISLAERGRVLRDLDEERSSGLVALLRHRLLPASGGGRHVRAARPAARRRACSREIAVRGRGAATVASTLRTPGRPPLPHRLDAAHRPRRWPIGVSAGARFLVRNWPLKLAAILGLATVLYAGLVLSENARTWTGEVPIEASARRPGAR